jgi:hypothetical protein
MNGKGCPKRRTRTKAHTKVGVFLDDAFDVVANCEFLVRGLQVQNDFGTAADTCSLAHFVIAGAVFDVHIMDPDPRIAT